VGTVVISNAGTTSTYYIKGTAGPAYNISPVVSATANTSGVVTYLTTVTDVFGNIPGTGAVSVTAIGATVGTISYDNTTGLSKVSVTYPATAGLAAISFGITATDIVGLPAAVKSVVKFVTITDLATTVANLNTELATEKANSVTALAAAKVASDKALADAKVASDKALADAKIASDAVLAAAKSASDKALADATALASSEKVKSDFALAVQKAKYNALVNRWNKKFPKTKIALLP
jgi:hypothetical protein